MRAILHGGPCAGDQVDVEKSRVIFPAIPMLPEPETDADIRIIPHPRWPGEMLTQYFDHKTGLWVDDELMQAEYRQTNEIEDDMVVYRFIDPHP